LKKTVSVVGSLEVIEQVLTQGLASAGMNVAILNIDIGKAKSLAKELIRKHGIHSAGIH